MYIFNILASDNEMLLQYLKIYHIENLIIQFYFINKDSINVGSFGS